MRLKATDLYFHRLFNEFSDGLIKIFIPVLIYSRTKSFLDCIIFLIGYYILQSIGNYLLYKPLTKNPILFLVLRIFPVVLIQYLFISNLNGYLLVVGCILAYSISNIFYWTPLNFLFTVVAKKNIGIKTGRFSASSIGGKLLAPVTSGFIMTYYEIKYVMILALIIYIISVIILVVPILKYNRSELLEGFGRVNKSISSNINIEITDIEKSRLFLFLLTFGMIGIFDTTEVFWSIYIYKLSINFFNVGLASTLIQVGILFSNLISGKITELKKWYIPASFALVLFSLSWILRSNTINIEIIFLISILSGLLRPIFTVPIFSNFINDANHFGHPQKWIALREISVKSGGLSIILVVSIFSNLIISSFYVSALVSILLLKNIKTIYNKHLNANNQ